MENSRCVIGQFLQSTLYLRGSDARFRSPLYHELGQTALINGSQGASRMTV